jgi:Rad3-related DNA helicase
MQIDPLNRAVRLSVRELAGFRNAPPAPRPGGGSWRAALGQEWHQTAAEQTRTQNPEARFEVSLEAIWRHRDWTFHIQGRIDQIIPAPDDRLTLREVKTIRASLPAPAEELAARYPQHLAQAATYLALTRVLPEFQNANLRAELAWIDIDTGTVQIQALEPGDEARFTEQLDALIPFLEDRRNARGRLQHAELKPPFETLREGQAEFQTALQTAVLEAPTLLLQAPTGFGKTGLVLQHALQSLLDGVHERLIFLSSQSTGQVQTRVQLEAMLGDGLRSIQMRNRREHRIESAAHTCTGDTRCEAELAPRWHDADLRPEKFFQSGSFELEAAKSLGRETGICPYALTKSCLPYAEVWIADVNYLFNPASRNVFEQAYGFDPARTCLVVDEAHNLPRRAADALSHKLRATEWLFALEALETAGAKRPLLGVGRALAHWIDRQKTGNPLPANQQYEALDLCEEFTRGFREARLDYAATPPFALDLAHRIHDLAEALAKPPHHYLPWVPAAGTLRVECLDPAPWIRACLQPFAQQILMSATLAPYPEFMARCGLETQALQIVEGHAPWREDAYRVAVDTRVDTRLKNRHLYYETTARSVAACIARSPGVPVAVFFSSYQYAENVRAYLETLEPQARATIQPRGLELAEQEAFIKSALLTEDALFLILGSSYAESIDALGGRVHTAMVVGPALPEVNCVREARREAHPSTNRESAFRECYLLPGMRRIHQALGRLVRAPGHRATILLQGRRFAEPRFHEALAPEYQSTTRIEDEAALHDWLADTPISKAQ